MAESPSRGGLKGGMQPSSGRRMAVFYDDRVMRAGWGILLFFSVLVGMSMLQNLMLDTFAPQEVPPHTILVPADILPNLVLLVAALTATLIAALTEQRGIWDYGFRSKRPLLSFLAGTVAGFAVVCTLVLLLHQRDLQIFRGETLFGVTRQWREALTWAGFLLVVAYLQENIIRGYFQYALTRGLAWLFRRYFAAAYGMNQAFWVGAVLLSALYVWLRHGDPAESPMGLLNAGLFCLLLSFSLWRTGSLWWALGFHGAWIWTQSFFFGLPTSGATISDHWFLSQPHGPVLQSGGDTGPEGSIFALGALAAGLVLAMLMPKRQLYPELWREAAEDSGERDDMLPDPGR